MLSAEENELLTRTDPGTPCGNLIRSYWQPAALSEELPPGGAPLSIRLLGEDLVLFRDEDGRPGLLGLHCAHRGADLSYGRLEDGGLRCLYHGWLYDVHGRCLEQPGEPAGSSFHEKIRQRSYPCLEVGDMIFAYLGTGEPPFLPAYEVFAVPSEHRHMSKTLQDCNYLQGNEANLDSQHHSFLHRVATDEVGSTRDIQANDGAPLIEPVETDYGVCVYSVRQVPPDQLFVKATQFIMPNLCAVTGYRDGYTMHWHVPIDDTHHWKYYARFNRRAPINPRAVHDGRGQELTPDYRLVRNSSNRYLQDREELQTLTTYAGLGFNNVVHDTWATETQGPIQDRTQERLGYNERGIVAARQVLLQALRDVQAGREPLHVVRDPSRNHFEHAAARKEVVPASLDWREYMATTVNSSDIAWAVT